MHLRDIINGAFYSVSFSCFYVGLVLFSSSERKIMRTPAHAHTHNTWMTDFRTIKILSQNLEFWLGFLFFLIVFFFASFCRCFDRLPFLHSLFVIAGSHSYSSPSFRIGFCLLYFLLRKTMGVSAKGYWRKGYLWGNMSGNIWAGWWEYLGLAGTAEHGWEQQQRRQQDLRTTNNLQGRILGIRYGGTSGYGFGSGLVCLWDA